MSEIQDFDGEQWIEKPIEEVLSGLEMKCHVAEGELVVGGIVLLKIVDSEGRVGLRQVTAGIDWLTEIGILQQSAADAAAPMNVKMIGPS